MNILNERGVMVALVLCTTLFPFARAEERVGGGHAYPTLGATPFPAALPLPVRDRLEVSRRIHARIVEKGTPPGNPGAMPPYDLTAPRAPGASMRMLFISGGEFQFGSWRHGGGPPRRVRIEPFWMGRTEVPWEFFLPYEKAHEDQRQRGLYRNHAGFLVRPRGREAIPLDDNNLLDFLAHPGWRECDPSLGGDLKIEPGYPAMCMTHHAASKFCQWLSAQTGHFYRLPTEAEWEYACRAGTTTAFHFGDDLAQLDDYAWHSENSEWLYHKVAQKKPNPWGLHDMHGNVAEWVLDGYDPRFRTRFPDGILNPWSIPQTRYPRIVKGGSWDHTPLQCHVHARTLSTPEWKDCDPQVPKNFWFNTDGQHVGFRIVRPLKTPSAEEMHLFWNTDWWDAQRNAEDLQKAKRPAPVGFANPGNQPAGETPQLAAAD